MLGLQSAPVPLKGKSSGNQMSSNCIFHCSETSSLQLISFCGYKNHKLDCPNLVSMKLICILLAPKPKIRIVPKFSQFIPLDFCWLPNQCIAFTKHNEFSIMSMTPALICGQTVLAMMYCAISHLHIS